MFTFKKRKSLKGFVDNIEKQFGRQVLTLLGGEGSFLDEPLSVISSGSINIDHVLGVGGFPRSRIIEIYGPPGSGKTTLALQTIAACQDQGGTSAFIDAEFALDPHYAAAIGIDLSRFIVAQPKSGEQAFQIIEALIRSKAIEVLVIDSAAALVPHAELESDIGGAPYGLQAKLMSKAMRKLAGLVSNTKSTLIFLNQTRHNVQSPQNKTETTPGGQSLKFFASIRMSIRQTGIIKVGERIAGNRIRVHVVKNKLAPPNQETETEIIYGKGISIAGELLDLGINRNLITRTGGYYRYDGQTIGDGRESARAWLEARPQIRTSLRLGALFDDDSRSDVGALSTLQTAQLDRPNFTLSHTLNG